MQKAKYLIIIVALFLVVLPFVAKPTPVQVLGQSTKAVNVVPVAPQPTRPPQIIYLQPQIYIGTTPVPTQKVVQNITNVTNVYAPTPTPTDIPTPSPTQVPTSTPVRDSITIKSGSDSWTANIAVGKTAFDAIKKAVGDGLTYTIYDCCGAFITGFHSTAAVSPAWFEFFINGSSSNVGVSSYIPVNGDVLEFKFHNE